MELVSNRSCRQAKSIIFCNGRVQRLIYMWSLILRLLFNVELQAKGLTLGPSARRKKDLLNRDQLRWVVGRTIYRTLSLKRISFQIGIDRWSHLRTAHGKRWINHTYPTWLWGHNLFNISSIGPLLYGIKWLLWRPHKQSSTFHSKWMIDKGLTKKGEAQ
jgi:hypothetical protein